MYTLHSLMAGILMLLALITVPATTVAAFDTIQPTTLATLTGTKGSDDWYTTSVTVTLAATDGADGSGVAKTEYSLDNAIWLTYSAPFVLDKNGGQYVYFRSTDSAGNIEAPAKSQRVKINMTGLVGLWHMDGDWKDASPLGNHATPYGSASLSSFAKVGTQAGNFNGATDYARIENADSLSPQIQGKMTISSWVYLRSYPSGGQNRAPIMSKGTPGNYEYALYIYSNGSAGLSLWTLDGTIGHVEFSGGTVPLNTWTHVSAVYDLSGTKKGILYINGTEVAYASTTSGTIGHGSSPIDIAHRPDNDQNQYVNGIIDEVAIYNRALSDSEIQEYYSNYVVNSPTVNPVTSPTAISTITLSGTKPANSAIVVNGNTLVPFDGTTSWQTSYTLSQGMNTISVTAQDRQNFNSLPVTLTVVLDSTAPQVTTTAPVNFGVFKTAPGAVTFALTDALSPVDFIATLNGATVKSVSGSNVTGTWRSAGSGSTGTVTFTPSSTLTEGAYTATIKPTDTLGNGTSSSITFTIDSTPPVAPGIDPVTALINTTSKTITGTKSSDSATVVVNCAGATIGTISYPTATTWSVNVSGLMEGSNTITAYAVDAAGNPGAMGTATITVDTNPPAVGATPAGGVYNSAQSVTLAANEQAAIYYTTDGSIPTSSAMMYRQPISIPAGATLKYFGRDAAGNNSELKTENYVIDTTPPVLAISTLSDGAYTSNEILNLAGTVMDNTGVIGITVNDTAVQVNADGSFSYALLLKNGANMITIAATDSVGNMAADMRTVTLDQAAPVLAVTTPADNSKTGKMLLEVSGTVDETSAVTVKMKDIVQSAVMNGGTFTATVILEPGYNTIEITAADLAGNLSTLKRTVVFDDHVPSLAVTVPSQDIRTNQRSLTIKGTVSHDLTAVGVTINKDNEILTPPVIDGTFEQAVNFAEEKTYGIVVTATNEVGTSTSIQRNFIYDITPPALSIDPVASPTSQPSLSVTGTREAGTAVTVTCATATVGEVSYPTATTWLVEIFGLREDENVITAASADAAGNAVTASASVVLASRPPEIMITATPDVIWPPNHQMVPVTIAGGVEPNGSGIKSVSISVSDEYGKFKYNNLTFGSTVMLEAWRNGNDTDGRKYTITVAVTDKRGITTAKTATVTVPHSQNQDRPQVRQGFQPYKLKVARPSKVASPSVKARIIK